MVSLPAEYQWSSYGAFIGKHKAPRFLETSRRLSNFGMEMGNVGEILTFKA
jgi:hypothetical protein